MMICDVFCRPTTFRHVVDSLKLDCVCVFWFAFHTKFQSIKTLSNFQVLIIGDVHDLKSNQMAENLVPPLVLLVNGPEVKNNADVGVDVLRESRVGDGKNPIIGRSEATFNVQMVNGDFLSLSVRISIHQSFYVNFVRIFGALFLCKSWNSIPEMLIMYVLL